MRALYWFLIIVLCSSLDLSAQVVNFNKVDSLGCKSGFWIENKSGATYVGQYIASTKTGQWVEYDSTGRITRILPFLDGELNGNVLVFNKDGIVTRDLPFIKGRLNGKVKFYSSSGTLLAIYDYNNDIMSGIEYYIINDESPPMNKDFFPEY